MRAFEVSLNGKKLCVAGIGEDGVLSTCLNWVTRGGVGDLFLQVGGLISPTEESVTWVRQKPLKVGDRVQFRIGDRKSVDEPIKRHRIDQVQRRREEKRYVREMAKRLGWTVQARAKARG